MPNRLAFRVMALVFAVPALMLAASAVMGLTRGRVVVVAFALAPVFAACAVGLWLMRAWGRSLALIVALGNCGVATLSLLAAILEQGRSVGPALFLALNAAVAYALSRPWFALPQEIAP